MTTLVTGATSQIGHFLLPKLAARGETVVALSRRPRDAARPNERWIVGALPDAQISVGLDRIISFGPLDALAHWLGRAEACPPRRLVATSSMSAESKRDSRVQAERALAQRLLDGEQRLIDVCRERGIACTILRPTLIYGAGLDRSLSPIARRAVRSRVFPLPPGSGLRQPVHAEDVAEAALRALEVDGAYAIVPMGGGERLSAAEMFRRVRASLPVATLALPIPRRALATAGCMLPQLRGPLLRLESDLVADNSELVRRFGLSPRGFHPTSDMWGLALR